MKCDGRIDGKSTVTKQYRKYVEHIFGKARLPNPCTYSIKIGGINHEH